MKAANADLLATSLPILVQPCSKQLRQPKVDNDCIDRGWERDKAKLIQLQSASMDARFEKLQSDQEPAGLRVCEPDFAVSSIDQHSLRKTPNSMWIIVKGTPAVFPGR